MGLRPLYSPEAVLPCYKLRYGWAGWPTAGTVFPDAMEEWVSEPCRAWEADGLRLLERSFSRERVLMTFSVTPRVAPVFFVARVKGRLQHSLARKGVAVKFSRKVTMQSIGENHRAEVEAYIEQQVRKEAWADHRAENAMRPFTVANPSVDLSLPRETNSGRYWYNLHLVLVTEGRSRNGDVRWLEKIRDQSIRIAAKKGYAISRLSVMPDHVHLALQGAVEHTPEQIALAFQNNLAYALGQTRVWQANYYVGTFGEYDMNAVRSWGE
jgi:REP element-mobilizing transposase RayT